MEQNSKKADALIETINMLKNDIQQLRSEVAMLRATKQGSGVDIVVLDDIVLYVPTNDNLYSNFIPNENKKYDLIARGLPKISTENEIHSPTKIFQDYIKFASHSAAALELYDIGAWAGDLAIRLGRYAKATGIDYRAKCYDPSLAGSLIPFNARINDVADIVDFYSIGISLDGGPLLFNQVRGHSDSSGLFMVDSFGRDVDSYIVNTLTLEQVLEQSTRAAHKIVKIDVEGIDALIVANNIHSLSECTLVIEFNPSQEQYKIISPRFFLAAMDKTHAMYDLFYAPKPSRAEKITDIDKFVDEISKRRWGYTDILMVPRSCDFQKDFDGHSALYTPEPGDYMLTKPFTAS